MKNLLAYIFVYIVNFIILLLIGHWIGFQDTVFMGIAMIIAEIQIGDAK